MDSDGYQGMLSQCSAIGCRRCAGDRDLNFDMVIAGFMQKRFSNGTFYNTDPVDCSPKDTRSSRECSLQEDNQSGFYESSSWEYSWWVSLFLRRGVGCLTRDNNRYAPHDTGHLVELMGGNTTFMDRLDHFFEVGPSYGSS